MKPAGGLLLLLTLAALAVAAPAMAGPWTLPKGDGQVIVKLEAMRADQGFNPDGDLLPLPAERRDTAVSLFAEYGLTSRLTVRLKGDWQSGEDAFVDYEGRGPLEIGLNWQVWRDDKTAVALYGGVADGGEGRNAGYADPGIGGQDGEVRVALGRSFGPARWMGRDATGGFVTLEAARRLRGGLPDETRVDATFGVHFGDKWMVLNQAYAGQADDGGPRWLSVETSLVRHFGPWAVQLGWREALSGRETPRSGGPVVGLWRRF